MPSPPAKKIFFLKLAKNIFRSALFHTQTRVSLKYPATDLWPAPLEFPQSRHQRPKEFHQISLNSSNNYYFLCYANLAYNEKHNSSIMIDEKTSFEISKTDIASPDTSLSTKDSIIFAKFSFIFAKM